MESNTRESFSVAAPRTSSPSSSKLSLPSVTPRSTSPRIQFQYENTDRPTPLPERLLLNKDNWHGPNLDLGQAQEEWTRLCYLRTNALRLRSKLQDKRAELREKEEMKTSADEAFMKYVRGRNEGSLSTATSPILNLDLEKFFSAMQLARDDYGEIACEYDGLEDLYAEVEYELSKLEGNIYSSPNLGIFDDTEHIPLEEADEYLTAHGLLGISEHSTDYHPLHATYLSRMGDLDLAWERYDNLMEEREVLMSKLSPGKGSDEGYNVLLQDLLGQATTLRSEITVIQEDIKRLKAQCLDGGIVLADTSDPSFSEIGTKNSSSGGSMLSTGLSNYVKFPVLQPQPEEKDGALTTELEASGPSDRINQWILDELRTSPLEVNLLMRSTSQMMENLDPALRANDDSQQQKTGLPFWTRDGVNKANGPFAFSRMRASSMLTSAMPSYRIDHPTKPSTFSQGGSGHECSSHCETRRGPASVM